MAAWRDVLIGAVPDLYRCCRDPWVVIGSAAVSLVGAAVHVADLDVLTSIRDAEVLSNHWQARRDAAYQPADAGHFRSRFARYMFPVLPVEVMGGLEVFGADGWKPVWIGEIVNLDILGLAIPVPSIAEQIRVLKGSGRPKDRQRVAALEALSESEK
jgi:hypothetical protein